MDTRNFPVAHSRTKPALLKIDRIKKEEGIYVVELSVNDPIHSFSLTFHVPAEDETEAERLCYRQLTNLSRAIQMAVEAKYPRDL